LLGCPPPTQPRLRASTRGHAAKADTTTHLLQIALLADDGKQPLDPIAAVRDDSVPTLFDCKTGLLAPGARERRFCSRHDGRGLEIAGRRRARARALCLPHAPACSMDATLAPAKLVHLQSLSRASCRARYATTFEFSLTRSSFSVVAMPDGAAISSSVRPGAARVRSLGALATRGPAELGKYSGRKANLRSKLCTYEARTAFFCFFFFVRA